ncbi:hypothetical protein K443DRAFT_126143 [Laccaria amethystina LaAM-08-1]|uniref:CxC5 like cysteine cluster associated with KDZ domain-containing protein n=1 Tax=Laccaria amethystina LaAM-08-1 TaxID=1095629 RepID=A0A0C9WHU3_9AGAR|nr:hypothetical protein K443DRAFT_126143 [Laccaria amethystina LaAM-08-1]
MNFLVLSTILIEHPCIAGAFTIQDLTKFIDLVSLLKPTLSLLQLPHQLGPPEHHPIHVHDFLKVSLDLDDDLLKLAWLKLCHVAWEEPYSEELVQKLGAKYIQLFLDHGYCQGVDFGPVPGHATSMYCRSCNTRYYANYYVHDNASKRTYYSSLEFEFFHIAQHVFIERRTCELFSTVMVMAWSYRTSATNCARIYNDGLANNILTPSLPAAFSKILVLDVDDVWSALFLYWLLTDCAEQGAMLQLEHNSPSQYTHLLPALQNRNARMVGPGQEEWNHACDLCCWVNTTLDGSQTYIQSVVVDGVTLGHPCCGVHDSGHQTCVSPSHQRLEDYLNKLHKAMFQLKHRLVNLKIIQPDERSETGKIHLPMKRLRLIRMACVMESQTPAIRFHLRGTKWCSDIPNALISDESFTSWCDLA